MKREAKLLGGGFALLLAVAPTLGVLLFAAVAASAATFGSNLDSPPAGSVCTFQSFEPQTHRCSVGQKSLLPGHEAASGLVAPFDGVVTSWTVVSGTPLPGTGIVKLGFRTMGGPGFLGKGPDVELPPSPAGTFHTFPERLRVSAGQPVGLKISVTNQSTQEAGAPLAFREAGVGTISVWSGEPWESISTTEEDVEILLSAEVEPDADRDEYGDLTQDCFPNRFDDQHLCGLDFIPPIIRARAARRQGFLRAGYVTVRVSSNEAGVARGEARLEIKGSKPWTYALRRAHVPITGNGQVVLRLRLPKRALKAARAARKDGKKMLATALVGVTDPSANTKQATVRIRPR